MNSIQVGYEGKLAMLKACFGGGDGDKPPPPLTAELFDAMFD